MRTRIKICGFTRAEDVEAACALGVDAVGLNFFSGPRRIHLARAAELLERVAPAVTPVALTSGDEVPANPTVKELLAGQQWRRPVTTFQLYGHEHPMGFLGRTGSPFCWWLTASIANRRDIAGVVEFMDVYELNMPSAVLLDAAAAGKLGGTGKKFDWNWIAEARAAGELNALPPIILAGGLTPENVAEAIRIARPYAVDVASGVEVAGNAGVKDAAKMRDFVQAVRAADAS